MNELVYKYPASLNDSNFNGVVEVLHEVLHFQAMDTNGHFLKRILKERMFFEMYGWQFQRYDKLYDIFDRKLQQLFTGGLIDYYDTKYKEQVNPKNYVHLQDPSGPKVLTMKHLEAGFIVWLFSVGLAVFVFVVEWIIKLKHG